MGVVLLVLFASISFSAFFDNPVDYFKKEEEVSKKELKEEYYRKVWRETQNWFPKDVSPIERELYKNPHDPILQEMYKKYVEERTYRSRLIAQILLSHFKSKEDILRGIKESALRFLYFYSPTCPYCKISEVALEDLSRSAEIITINVDSENPQVQEMVALFQVRATPTLVAMKGIRVVDVWIGAFTWDSMEFHRWLSGLVSKVRGETAW